MYIHGQVTLTAAEEDVSGDKEDVAMDTVFGAEPFARHFEYSLKEEEVKQLTELYTDPGDVDTLQVNILIWDLHVVHDGLLERVWIGRLADHAHFTDRMG